MYENVINCVRELALSQQRPVFKQGRPIFEWSSGVPIKDNNQIINYNSDSDSLYESDDSDYESISSSNSDTDYDNNNDVDEDLGSIIVTDDYETNLEHSSDEINTHSSSDDDVDQDNDNAIVQDDDYIHPPSKILDIDPLSSNYDTSSVEITDNNSTEEDLHKKMSPKICCLNAGPHRADSGTGVPSFEPSFKGKTYKTTKTRQKNFSPR